MARISGVTIPTEKQVWVSFDLCLWYWSEKQPRYLGDAKVEPTVRVKDLTDAEIARIQEIINDEVHRRR